MASGSTPFSCPICARRYPYAEDRLVLIGETMMLRG